MSSSDQRLDRIERKIPKEPADPPPPPEMPHIIEFVISKRFLNRPGLYPRQATLLKLIFLAVDLFTDFDMRVLAGWGAGQVGGLEHDRQYGLVSDILERIEINRAAGRSWFREVVAVIGRRGSKGYLGAISVAYVLWWYLGTRDPQAHFGIAYGKTLTLQVFAVNKDQARDVFWRDLRDVIVGAPCFAPYLAEVMADRILLWSPIQLTRPLLKRGSPAFEIVARGATESAGRGYASPVQVHDEMAHSIASGSARSAEEIYQATLPAQTQFGTEAFSWLASSPKFMTGQFYQSHLLGLVANADGGPAHPEVLTIQVPCWDLYLDWEQWETIPLYPGGPTSAPIFRAVISEDDDDVVRVRATNPEMHRVEYCSLWAEVLVAFLHREKVFPMFEPFDGRVLEMQSTGSHRFEYVAHCDLSLVKDNTALVVAHCEPGVDPRYPLYIIDRIRVWKPGDFLEGHIKLAAVEVELQTCITDFEPQWLTFDSFQSAGPIQNLTEFARDHGIRTHVDVFAPGRVESRRIAELFKGVLYDGRVHSPMHPLALDELLFLQDLGHRVEAPATGPVDTDDVADCLFAVVARLTELSHDPGRLFSGVGLHATGWPSSRADQQVFDRLADPRSNRGQKYQRLRGGKTTREHRRQRRY